MRGLACWNLALAIGLGAFGAHGLRGRVSEQALEWFRTGHSYHMWVGLALLGLALAGFLSGRRVWVGWGLVFGTVFFCGSLYLMTVTGMRWLGAVTPVGGVAWIVSLGAAGWMLGRERAFWEDGATGGGAVGSR